MELAKLKGEGNKLSAKLSLARKNEAELLNKFADIRILLYWLRIDILSLAGPEWSEKMELLNFIIEELELGEVSPCKRSGRIGDEINPQSQFFS